MKRGLMALMKHWNTEANDFLLVQQFGTTTKAKVDRKEFRMRNAFLRTISGVFGLFAGLLGVYVPLLYFVLQIRYAEALRQNGRVASSRGIVMAVLVALIFVVPCGFVAYRSVRFAITGVKKKQARATLSRI